MEKECNTCKFMYKYYDEYQCRRFPPIIKAPGMTCDSFPKVLPHSYFCGEHREK